MFACLPGYWHVSCSVQWLADVTNTYCISVPHFLVLSAPASRCCRYLPYCDNNEASCDADGHYLHCLAGMTLNCWNAATCSTQDLMWWNPKCWSGDRAIRNGNFLKKLGNSLFQLVNEIDPSAFG